jgi:uncharacterized membrane-anchored protein
MQQYHVPRLGLRYWSALCIASIFGANMGDFFAHNLGLGHVAGLPFLALALVLIFIAERFDRAAHEAYYWLAIVVVRTAATNLADFFSVDLRLGKPWVMSALAALLALTVAVAWQLVWRGSAAKTDAQRNLLRADYGYWLAMLIAGTLGTVMGDFVSHDLHFGVVYGTILLGALLAPFFIVGARLPAWPLALYWATIVMVRAAGTVAGDLLAARHMLGLPLSTALTGAAFVALLAMWRNQKANLVTEY